jgi:hypothetical protein
MAITIAVPAARASHARPRALAQHTPRSSGQLQPQRVPHFVGVEAFLPNGRAHHPLGRTLQLGHGAAIFPSRFGLVTRAEDNVVHRGGADGPRGLDPDPLPAGVDVVRLGVVGDRYAVVHPRRGVVVAA